MTGHSAFLPIAGLMFVAGIGIPVMATFNAGLGQQLDNPVAATFMLFLLGTVVAAAIMVATGSLPDASRFTFERPYVYAGAVFMAFYALSITWAAPRIGVANAVFFVLLGQLVAAALIDHYGLWGAMKSAITARRAGGIMLIAIGVYLARRPI